MTELTSKERITRILNHQPVDHIGVQEGFWEETRKKWVAEGHVGEDENLLDHFNLDVRDSWSFNMCANLDFGEELVEETEETKLIRDGNGALMRIWKDKTGTPEHVDFMVKDRAGWEEHIRPFLVDESLDRRRINFEFYRKIKAEAEKTQNYFCWSGVNVFELMHPVCGHEYMLMGMALDPDWVKDMCTVYTDLNIRLFEILFAEEGIPDGVWYCEDMGFKQRPFMSPAMYKDIVWPAHKRTFSHARSLGLKVIMHSCGFIEPLVGYLIEAGIDCLQAMEVKAGMDVVRLKKTYGDKLALCGGMDIRTLETNDLKVVEAELQKKLPAVMDGSGYILYSDHSIPESVEYETYKYFIERGREIGTYK